MGSISHRLNHLGGRKQGGHLPNNVTGDNDDLMDDDEAMLGEDGSGEMLRLASASHRSRSRDDLVGEDDDIAVPDDDDDDDDDDIADTGKMTKNHLSCNARL